MYGNPSNSCYNISLKTRNVNLTTATRWNIRWSPKSVGFILTFHGNSSNSWWDILYWTKVVDWPTNIPSWEPCYRLLRLYKSHSESQETLNSCLEPPFLGNWLWHVKSVKCTFKTICEFKWVWKWKCKERVKTVKWHQNNQNKEIISKSTIN